MDNPGYDSSRHSSNAPLVDTEVIGHNIDEIPVFIEPEGFEPPFDEEKESASIEVKVKVEKPSIVSEDVDKHGSRSTSRSGSFSSSVSSYTGSSSSLSGSSSSSELSSSESEDEEDQVFMVFKNVRTLAYPNNNME